VRCRSGTPIAILTWAVLGCGGVVTQPAVEQTPREPVVWRIDNLRAIGGHPVTVIGSPRIVETGDGAAIEFNGQADGLVLDVNPLAGLARFTVEIVFQPAPGGPPEQRFLHFEEGRSGNRALIETRMLSADSWCLDTFLRHGTSSLTLIDRSARHPAGRWHVATLTYDGRIMRHYVSGRLEASGRVSFRPLASGRTAIGMRLNQVHWFSGLIRGIRVTPDALRPDQLLIVTSRAAAGLEQTISGPDAGQRARQARGSAAAGRADIGAVVLE
jgi:hypothetical protein